MSDNAANEGSASNQSGGEGHYEKVDVSEVLKRLEQLESTNKRLLEESKGHKKEAYEYKSKLDEIEKKKLESSGDEKAQIEYERKQRERFEKENKALKNKTLDQNIRLTISKYAKDVHNLEDILVLPEFKKMISEGIDPENLSVDEEIAKNTMNTILEKRPYFKRNTTQAGVDRTRPNGANVTQKSLKAMSDEELNRLIYGE